MKLKITFILLISFLFINCKNEKKEKWNENTRLGNHNCGSAAFLDFGNIHFEPDKKHIEDNSHLGDDIEKRGIASWQDPLA